MIPLNLPWRLIGVAGVLAFVGLVVWRLQSVAYNDGFADGKADSQAFYRPLLEEVERRAHEAKGRIEALEKAAAATNSRIESEDAQRAKQAEKQRDDAMRKLADMRVRLASALASGSSVSGVSNCPADTSAAPGESGHFAEADRRLAELAHGCQRDADRLIAWQEWYRQHAAVINQSVLGSAP